MPSISKARILSNIDVTYISLVDKGANKKTIIWKSADDSSSNEPAFSRVIDVLKTDDEKRLVYGIVYAPGEWDSHEDTATAEEIEKAAHHFMKKARTQQVDKQHDLNADQGYVAESWIVRDGDNLFSEVGAWAVAIKVEDEETWQLVKSGDIAGISLYGTANYEEIEKMDNPEANQESGPLSRLKKWLGDKAGSIKKDFSSHIRRNELSDAVYALWYALDDIVYDQSVADKHAALIEETQKFTDYIQSKVMSKAEKPEEVDTSIAALEKKVDSLASSVEKLTSALEKMAAAPAEPAENEEPAADPVAKQDDAPDPAEELLARIEKLEAASAGRQSQDRRPAEKAAEEGIGIPFFE